MIMNENIDLTLILKDCPKGFKLYSSICGTVTFEGIDYHDSNYPICVKTPTITVTFSKKGLYFCCYGDSECCLFPSSEQRDWSKFTAPWYKKERDAIACLETQGEDKKEINNNFDVLPGLYKCIHRMFDGTPDGRLLFEIDNVYKCLSKHNRAEFEVSYGHSVYLEDPIVRRYFIPFEGEQISSPKFNPNTLNAFDKVLGRNGLDIWRCDFFSSYMETYACKNVCIGGSYLCCIPYNDDTKRLIGTNDEAPEYYRYWED